MIINYSIIIPYRDKLDLFLKAFNSIPDRDDIEIIIVDNSLQPLSHNQIPCRFHSHVIYAVSDPTKGAGCARNIGLSYVKGIYVLFLDADDYFTQEAFPAFDKYIEEGYDIVFFKPTSVNLSTRLESNRHLEYESYIDLFFNTGKDDRLRYRWTAPWAKLFHADYIKNNNFQFDEVKVGNDSWFSVQTGHYAKRIKADKAVVYVVTEGEVGQSLVKTVTKENERIRFNNAIRINHFLNSVGHFDMHTRLLGFVKRVYVNFGLREALYFIYVALKKGSWLF